MAQQWSILVVEGDEALNRSIVNTLAKDGYSVRGVATGGEAIRILWVDEQHLVISDRTLPDADGFDLLQWIRTYRPATRMMMLAAANLRGARTQALENGAVAYLEKPLDLLLLKVEVRRLLQQSGFSASLSSFDLLDVIQIINMSRKSIALLVHTGLEEQGLLGFKVGELTWAEYGNLRGEEAFFALAAYKNGTVTQQPWNDAVAPNVTQPLSRLILQALQYRSKYASAQQLSGEHEAVSNHPTMHGEEPVDLDALDIPFDALLTEMPDDRPFVYVAEEAGTQAQGELEAQTAQVVQDAPPVPVQAEAKEWWQESAKVRRVEQVEPAKRAERAEGTSNGNAAQNGDTPVPADPAAPHVHQRKRSGMHSNASNGASITPSTVRKTPTGQRPDLPSWLMDQPTQFEIQALRPSSLTGTGKVPSTPVTRASNAEWQPPQRPQPFQEPQPSPHPQQPQPFQQPPQKEMPRQTSGQTPRRLSSPALQSLKTPRITEDLAMRTPSAPPAPQTQPEPPQLSFPVAPVVPVASPVVRKATFGEVAEAETGTRESRETRKLDVPQSKRNYPALVAALQTLGYSLPGFVASAVVSMDGQPIAQVAIDDLDIAGMCTHFSVILQAATRSLDEGGWERHEDTIITSATHHILLRVLGNERDTFQALVTTRETDPVESLDVLANVEGAIIAAL